MRAQTWNLPKDFKLECISTLAIRNQTHYINNFQNECVTIAVKRNLSNCEIARKKVFRSFNGIRTRGLCVRATVLYQLIDEDPCTAGRPIYWVHQPVKGMKHRMKWCELREYKWNEYVTIAVRRNLSNCEIAWKKVFRGFIIISLIISVR